MAEPHVQLLDEYWLLDSIEARAVLPRTLRPRKVATIVMCTLAERLTPGQAHRLLDALPPDVQSFLAPCWRPLHLPVAKMDDAMFLDQLGIKLDVTPAHAELIADSVFRAVREILPDDVIEHVAMQLPHDLIDLWLGTRSLIMDDAIVPNGTVRWELLNEISEGVPLPVGVSACDALVAVVGAFSQRLSGGEARDVFLGLPSAIRALVEHCFAGRQERAARFDRLDLVERIADELETTPRNADQIVRVVLTAVKRQLPIREQHDVASQLPADLRRLWEDA